MGFVNLRTTASVAAALLELSGCSGGDDDAAEAAGCEPAQPSAVENIGGLLAADPTSETSIADGAQQVAIRVPLGGAASEFQSLIGARMQPSGALGLWGAVYLDGSFISVQPVNDEAIGSMPGGATMTSAAAATRDEILSSEAAAALILCME